MSGALAPSKIHPSLLSGPGALTPAEWDLWVRRGSMALRKDHARPSLTVVVRALVATFGDALETREDRYCNREMWERVFCHIFGSTPKDPGHYRPVARGWVTPTASPPGSNDPRWDLLLAPYPKGANALRIMRILGEKQSRRLERVRKEE